MGQDAHPENPAGLCLNNQWMEVIKISLGPNVHDLLCRYLFCKIYDIIGINYFNIFLI